LANGRYFIREWQVIHKDRPDVILMRYNLLSISLAIISKIKKIHFVLEINAPMAYENRHFSEYVQLPVIPELLERLNLILADAVIVVSRELKEYYTKWGIHPDKITVVPNGADENRFHPDLSGAPVRIRYHMENRIVIGFIGSFHYWHGVDNLVNFIKQTLKAYSQTIFFLVGHGPMKEGLENQLKEEVFAGRVVFSGYISHSEIPYYLAAMDVLLAPYPKLAFFYYSPIKIYEYLAAGKAVLTSRVGQIKEIIQDNENGMLFEANNFDEMKVKCFQLIENKTLRAKLGKQARKFIEKQGTWHHSAEIISRLLHDITDSNARICIRSRKER
jgi:glycosyltransferase involved in cell wall biosynthesis